MSDKIIDRIKKLLSLSQSNNEHEAALAAGQAADLMFKHEIKEAQLCESDEDKEDVDVTSLDETGSIVNWKGNLMNGLADGLGCAMHFSQIKKRGEKMKTFYNVVGQPSKVDTIKYMYHYLVGEVDRLADKAYREEYMECKKSNVLPPSARSWKNAFRLGASSMIAKRLRKQREESHKDAEDAGLGFALVVVKKSEEAVVAFVAKKYPKLKKAASATYRSGSGYGAGAEAGKGVGLGNSGNTKLGAGSKQLSSGS